MSPLFLPNMAHFISSMEMDNIPEEAVARAKLVMMDCVWEQGGRPIRRLPRF